MDFNFTGNKPEFRKGGWNWQMKPICAPRQRPSDSDSKAVGVSATEQGVGAHLFTNCTITICAGLTDRAEFIRDSQHARCEIRFDGRLYEVNRSGVTLDRDETDSAQ
jgi:hypothetical protein